MENLLVISKIKKFAKEQYNLSLSQTFLPKLNEDIAAAVSAAIEHADKAGRKTVMGRDFNFYVHEPKVEEILVVQSKLKTYIKDKNGMSTSKQCAEQLSVRVQKIIQLSGEKAMADKRKTVMDRDLSIPLSF